MKIIQFALALIIFVLALLFALRNATPVNLDYIWGTVDTPLSYVALGGCVIGLIVGFLACGATILRLRRDNLRFKRTAREARAEVTSLRKAPLKDEH